MRHALDTYHRRDLTVANVKPSHNFRVSDDIWTPAVRKATEQGVTITSVIIDALEAYVIEPEGMRTVPRSLEEIAMRLTPDRAEQLAHILITKLRNAK